MSYCVNCGVELDKSAQKCALCSTPVINPNVPAPDRSDPPFSSEEHIPKTVKQKFIALMISMVVLVPNIVCILINAVFFGGSFWALYLASTSFLLWVIFVFPFFTKKLRPFLMWGFDTVSVAFYVYFFFAMGNDTTNWYLKAALPIIIFNSLLVLIFMLWQRKKKRHWVLKTMHIFIDIGLSSFICGLILSVELAVSNASVIGFIILVCCVAIDAFLAYGYSSKTMRRWFSKRFFT